MGFWVLGISFLNKGEPYGSPFVFARRDAINCISTIQHPAHPIPRFNNSTIKQLKRLNKKNITFVLNYY